MTSAALKDPPPLHPTWRPTSPTPSTSHPSTSTPQNDPSDALPAYSNINAPPPSYRERFASNASFFSQDSTSDGKKGFRRRMSSKFDSFRPKPDYPHPPEAYERRPIGMEDGAVRVTRRASSRVNTGFVGGEAAAAAAARSTGGEEGTGSEAEEEAGEGDRESEGAETGVLDKGKGKKYQHFIFSSAGYRERDKKPNGKVINDMLYAFTHQCG